jgi:hypothetical protein
MLGATRSLGRHLLRRRSPRGHDVTVFVRTLSKLPPEASGACVSPHGYLGADVAPDLIKAAGRADPSVAVAALLLASLDPWKRDVETARWPGDALGRAGTEAQWPANANRQQHESHNQRRRNPLHQKRARATLCPPVTSG